MAAFHSCGWVLRRRAEGPSRFHHGCSRLKHSEASRKSDLEIPNVWPKYPWTNYPRTSDNATDVAAGCQQQRCRCTLTVITLQGLILLQVTHNRQWLRMRLWWRWLGIWRPNKQSVLLERLSLQLGNDFLEYLWSKIHNYGIWLQYSWRAWVSTLLQTEYVIWWHRGAPLPLFHPCYFCRADQNLGHSTYLVFSQRKSADHK